MIDEIILFLSEIFKTYNEFIGRIYVIMIFTHTEVPKDMVVQGALRKCLFGIRLYIFIS
jgi:hypothetical protein